MKKIAFLILGIGLLFTMSYWFNSFEKDAYKLVMSSMEEIEYDVRPEVKAICSKIRADKHDQCLTTLKEEDRYEVTTTVNGFTATIWGGNSSDVKFTEKSGKGWVLNPAEDLMVSRSWLCHYDGYLNHG